ncbi:hypothetical protein Tco_0940361 [Tanacetum coccineum]|uniref:Uncharacterized protein n=1 Tax=Tanacetum coccineum TaxID=301880 RepID=A0ABQ5DMT2_9ASTR
MLWLSLHATLHFPSLQMFQKSTCISSGILVQGQDFDALPTDEEIVSFLRDLGYTGEIHSLNDVVVDQMHQPWRTVAALINRSLSGKTTQLIYELPPSLICFLCQNFQRFRRHASHSELFDQEVESFSWQGFGEYVSHNKSFPACRVKSVGSTAPSEKCCEIRKLDSMSYHARGACLRP